MEYVKDRRDFLISGAKAVAAFAALNYLGCGGSPSGPQLPKPAEPVIVSGLFKGTQSGNKLYGYKITFKDTSTNASTSADAKTDGGYSLQLTPGRYEVTVEANGILLPRVKTVDVQPQNPSALTVTSLDLDGIDDMSFPLDHYREMCEGIGSDTHVNVDGKSYRFGLGVQPKIFLDLNGAPKKAKSEVQNAIQGVHQLTGGILNPSYAEINSGGALTTLSNGDILVIYDSNAQYSDLVENTVSGPEIKTVKVRIKTINADTSKIALHELGHAIGLDHVNSDKLSLMNRFYVNSINLDDIKSVTLKYLRNPGATTLNGFDED